MATLISGYVTLSFTGLCIVILMVIIAHLLLIAKRTRKQKINANKKQVMFIITVTLIGILSFQICLILIATLVTQLLFTAITIRQVQLLKNVINIFDSFGHLAMITVFIIRLKMCFENNSMFGYSKKLLFIIYSCLLILAAISVFIMIQMSDVHNTYVVIVSEIIWEALIEFMCLWLLYLFMSKLSELITMSLSEDELNLTISYILSKNTADSNNSNDHVNHNNNAQNSSTYHLALNGGPNPNRNKPSYDLNDNNEEDNEMDFRHRLSVSEYVRPRKLSEAQTANDPQIIYLVNIITKMCVLVLIAVLCSAFSIGGTVYFEWNQLYDDHVQFVWMYILPVIDILITSICLLYLQFNHTNQIYNVLCTKVDALFVRIIRSFLRAKMKHARNESECPADTQPNRDGEYAE